MRFVKNKYLVLLIWLLVSVSVAADIPLQVRLMKSLKQKAAGWIWLQEAVPLTGGKLQLKIPLETENIQLLRTDAQGQIILFPRIRKEEIDYSVRTYSGERLGGFRINRDNDLPLPATEIDAQNQQIYFMDVDGRISACDYRGRELWRIAPPRSFVFTYENSYFCNWNAQRQKLFTVYSAPAKSEGRRFDTYIRLYDAMGRLTRRRIIPGVQALKTVWDEDGQKAIVLARTAVSAAPFSVLLLDSLGRVRWQKTGRFRQARFLAQDQILLALKNKLRVIAGVSGKVLKEYIPVKKDYLLADALCDGQGNIAVVSGRPFYSKGKLRFAKPEVTIIEGKSGTIRQVLLKGQIYLPRGLYFSKDGELQIGCESGLYRISF